MTTQGLQRRHARFETPPKHRFWASPALNLAIQDLDFYRLSHKNRAHELIRTPSLRLLTGISYHPGALSAGHCIWDADNTTLLYQFKNGHRDWIASTAFLPGGEYVISTSLDRK